MRPALRSLSIHTFSPTQKPKFVHLLRDTFDLCAVQRLGMIALVDLVLGGSSITDLNIRRRLELRRVGIPLSLQIQVEKMRSNDQRCGHRERKAVTVEESRCLDGGVG